MKLNCVKVTFLIFAETFNSFRNDLRNSIDFISSDEPLKRILKNVFVPGLNAKTWVINSNDDLQD